MGNIPIRDCCTSDEKNDQNKSALHGRSFRKNLILERTNKNVLEEYEVIGVIGTGSISTISSIRKRRIYEPICFANFLGKLGMAPKQDVLVENVEAVQQCSKKDQKQLFALKTIDLRRVKQDYIDELRNEVEILRGLDHPNIVKAFEAYEYRRRISVVMEMCSGGDLYARIPYNEVEACHIMRKILSAVSYMHENNIIHRDLKMENIMFESRHPDAEIKIIDFGLSKKYLPQEYISNERVGTLYTMAPEVIKGTYTEKADLWSIGVVAYMLLSNKKPFWGKTSNVIIDKIMTCHYSFRGSCWHHVSRQGKDFIRSLLKRDPEHRLSAEEALSTPWIHSTTPLSKLTPKDEIDDSVHECLLKFDDCTQFKKLVLMVIAFKSTNEEILGMRRAFEKIDSRCNGTISFSEFKRALSEYHHSDKKLLDMFQSMDINHNGHIDYTEFLAATLETHGRIEEERLAQAFDRLDCDCTGFISRGNLKNILGKQYTEDLAEKLMKEVDQDYDGKISYDEFLNAFRHQKQEEVRKMCHVYVGEKSIDDSPEFGNIDFNDMITL